MLYEVKDALEEIMNIAPMYRRDYVMNYVRKNLPKEEAKRLFFERDKKAYIERMRSGGYASGTDLLDTIGKERILKYFHIISRLS